MEFASANIVKRGNQIDVNYGDDSQIVVEFYFEPVRMGAASDKAGRDIYEDVAFIHMMFPGDRTKERRTKATEEHKHRFARQWDAFQREASQAPVGTPIELWAPIGPSTAKTLKAANILTVELLAGCSDQALNGCGVLGGRKLREQAQAWLAQAKEGARDSQLAAENEALRADVEMLKAQIAELGAAKRGTRRAAPTEEA